MAKAVEDVIHRLHPEVEVKTITADGLRECRQMLRIARTGKYDGYLLEGMACPGGVHRGCRYDPAARKVPPLAREIQVRGVSIENPLDTEYIEDISMIHEDSEDWDVTNRH